MFRDTLNQELKQAMKAQDSCAVATLRLILAALKDRDIAAREQGVSDGIGEDEILLMLQKMVRQREESIQMYRKGKRPDLAEREAKEIRVIERFLPKRMDEAETADAVAAVIDEIEAKSIKDMGKVMGALKARFAGQMDFRRANELVKARLT